MFEKELIWDGVKHETKGCWDKPWFCPFLSCEGECEWRSCHHLRNGAVILAKERRKTLPILFSSTSNTRFSSRLFSGNPGISTINRLVATAGKRESKLRRSWAGKGAAVKRSRFLPEGCLHRRPSFGWFNFTIFQLYNGQVIPIQ